MTPQSDDENYEDSMWPDQKPLEPAESADKNSPPVSSFIVDEGDGAEAEKLAGASGVAAFSETLLAQTDAAKLEVPFQNEGHDKRNEVEEELKEGSRKVSGGRDSSGEQSGSGADAREENEIEIFSDTQ